MKKDYGYNKLQNYIKSKASQSIKGKLFVMCLVSVICIMLLGITSLVILSRNGNDYIVTTNMNKINLIQYENKSINTNYLYSFDNALLEQIESNLGEILEIAEETQSLATGTNKSDINQIIDLAQKNITNLKEIIKLNDSRGFTNEEGKFKEFLANDEAISKTLEKTIADKSWVDLSMGDISSFANGTLVIDNKQYNKVTYVSNIPNSGKRLEIIPRIGGNGVEYKGTVYINNIVLENGSKKQQIDLGKYKDDDLKNSYGFALSSFTLSKLNNNPSIEIKSNFTKANNKWEEIDIKLPASDIDTQDYSKISYDVYFEAGSIQGLSAGMAMNNLYDFVESFNSIVSNIDMYNKLVAEGSDVQASLDEIAKLFEEIKTNFPIYLHDDTIIQNNLGKIINKQNTFNEITESDKELLEFKSINNTLEEDSTTLISTVKENIETKMNTRKTFMLILVTTLLIISTLVIGFITFAIKNSIYDNMKQFSKILDEVADGNLLSRSKTKSMDEFSIFSKKLNEFLDKLSSILCSVQRLSD